MIAAIKPSKSRMFPDCQTLQKSAAILGFGEASTKQAFPEGQFQGPS